MVPVRRIHMTLVISFLCLLILTVYHSNHTQVIREVFVSAEVPIVTLSEKPSDPNLAPCGAVCKYEGALIKDGHDTLYPRMRKRFNCDNIMKRMAYRGHEMIWPPPRNPPEELLEEFTQNGEMPIKSMIYMKRDGDHSRFFSEALIDDIVDKAKEGVYVNSYKDANCAQDALSEFRDRIKGGSGVVIGTERPWLEGIMLANDAAKITTLEYGNMTTDHPKVAIVSPYSFADDYLAGTAPTFDFGASFSSLEHSGLGRYGDPLNPYGDLEAMAQAWCMIKPGGMFAVGLPSSEDDSSYILWNAHRVYGRERLVHFLANWEVDDIRPCGDIFHHRFFVLTKRSQA